MVFVYITCKDKKEANKICTHLLKKRLVACTNSFPIDSQFWWKEKITKVKEVALLAKTTKEKFSSIKTEVSKIHSYKIPCVCLLNASTEKKFGSWVIEQVR